MGIFFLSWALWQQMTFALACAIVFVFCAGLCKLWWTNRILRKQEVLDEEKRARLQEMRRTGLAVKRANDIPFGVRAIQSGIEVDGIWISRPTSPTFGSSTRLASSTTLVGVESASQKSKGKTVVYEYSRLGSLSALEDRRAAVMDSLSEASTIDRPVDPDTTNSTSSDSSAAPHFPITNNISNRMISEPLIAPVVRLEEQRRPTQQPISSTSLRPTYSPAYEREYTRRQTETRSSGSSGEIHGLAQTRIPPSSGAKNGQSTSAEPPQAEKQMANLQDYMPWGSSLSRPSSPETSSTDPFATPTETPSALALFPEISTRASLLARQEQSQLNMPEPTFGPGDRYANTSTRRVNQGFEIFPAGTFGSRHTGAMTASDESEDDTSRQRTRLARPRNKLRKKSTAS